MQSTNIYKIKPILCFTSKMAANGKDREWGRGGSATCVCNANERGPLNFFSIVAPLWSTVSWLCSVPLKLVSELRQRANIHIRGIDRGHRSRINSGWAREAALSPATLVRIIPAGRHAISRSLDDCCRLSPLHVRAIVNASAPITDRGISISCSGFRRQYELNDWRALYSIYRTTILAASASVSKDIGAI